MDLRCARPFRYIEPSLAKQVAEGDACPISLLPMEDINPGFVPRALKTIPMNTLSAAMRTPVARPDKGKSKAKELPSEKPSNVGLLKFFCKSALRSLRRRACRSPLCASCFLRLRVRNCHRSPTGAARARSTSHCGWPVSGGSWAAREHGHAHRQHHGSGQEEWETHPRGGYGGRHGRATDETGGGTGKCRCD